MKVVHILPAFTKGGCERVVVELANEGVRRGWQVSVIAARRVEERWLRNDLLPEVEVVYISEAAGRFMRYPLAAAWLARNWAWLREADVLHCHLTIGAAIGSLAYAARRLSGRAKPAVVETYHAVGVAIPRWHRWIHAHLARQRDAVALMAEDPFWRAFAASGRPAIVRTIANGVSLSPGAPPGAKESRAYRRAVGIPDDCPIVVGTVGRLAAARKPWLYPEIFALIARHFPDARFFIGGDGPERARVEAAVDEAGLRGRVHMPGLVESPRLAFSVMDLYLTLNVGPVTGVAAIEAALAGLPVVAIQLVEGREPLESDWIWSSTDLRAVAARAVELLADRGRLRACAQKQQAHAKDHHGVDAMADAYDRLYAAALARARRAAREHELPQRTLNADHER